MSNLTSEPRCIHPAAGLILIRRGYGSETFMCHCGYTLSYPAREPIDLRQFGGLRTWLGDEPKRSDQSNEVQQ